MEDLKNCQDPQMTGELQEIVGDFRDLPVRHLRMKNINFSCPCSSINEGVDLAQGQYVIMTNPECMHRADVLGGLDQEFERSGDLAYVVCSCMSVNNYPEWKTKPAYEQFTYKDRQWYQHTNHANYQLNFCTALAKAEYIKFGGFNEEFDRGIGRADVEFIHAVGRAGLKIINRDDLLTLHLDHPESFPTARRKELVDLQYSIGTYKSRFKP